MSTTRRDFLRTTTAAGAVAALGSSSFSLASPAPRAAAPRSAAKKILILGGTAFIGPQLVEAARARGHEITIFNRGRTEKKIGEVKGVEHLFGNRDPNKNADENDDPKSPKGLESLKGRTWDAVVDTSGQYRRIVRASAELLAPSVKQYIYISSVSVYKDSEKVGADTSAEVHTLTDPDVETMGKQFENYGGLKALCEKTVEEFFPGRSTAVRPGLIVGPGDGTDRFTYWPVRVQRGGEVLSPGTPDDPIQIIDVRDLAEWLVVLIENNTTGVFDAIGPQTGLTIGGVLDSCKRMSKSDAKFTWVNTEFLAEQQVSPWGDMPVWVPPSGDSAGFHRRDVSKSIAAGMKNRDIDTTVRDTLDWFPKEIERRKRVTAEMIAAAEKDGKPKPQMADPTELRAGIKPDREAKVLAAWHAKQGG